MKIAITGHTSGIGKSLYDYYTSRSHEVHGFSRSNGFDLKDRNTINQIVDAVENCDIFINNAFYGLGQVQLLYAMHDRWESNSSKTHVVISSNSGDVSKKKPHQYAILKTAVDNTVSQLRECANYRLINIRPGYVDTPRVSHITGVPKINPDELAEFIAYSLSQKNFLLSNVTILPNNYD